MGIDRSCAQIGRHVPHVLQELAARLHPAAAPRERSQQAKFGRCEQHFVVVHPNAMGAGVDTQGTDAQSVVALFDWGSRVSAKYRANPQHQFATRKGLGHVIVGPDLEADYAVEFFAAGREHDHRDIGQRRIGANTAAYFGTLHAGKHQVEQHQRRLERRSDGEHFGAGGEHADGKAFAREMVAK